MQVIQEIYHRRPHMPRTGRAIMLAVPRHRDLIVPGQSGEHEHHPGRGAEVRFGDAALDERGTGPRTSAIPPPVPGRCTRPVTSWAFGKRLGEAGPLGSVGTVSDCYDKAMLESF
jgi:hypothetical protein